jgi:predicted branched-subunit amino acid permease
MSIHRASVFAGARDILPVLPGMAPFGLITGVAATNAGFSLVEAMGMSVFVYAGAAQLAAYELIKTNALLVIVVLTVIVINLRLPMYSASLAPYFEHLPWRWKGVISYHVVDPVYALSIVRFENDDGGAGDASRVAGRGNRRWYFLGAATPLWVIWQISTLVGIVVGARIPGSWHLDFAFPLVFLALVAPSITDRATASAAAVAGVAAVLSEPLPLDLGIIVSAVAGIAAGLTVESMEA